MDNLLQLQILQVDTRGLFVPTSLQKLVIDAKAHAEAVAAASAALEEGKNAELFAYVIPEIELIRSGGVEVRGLKASAIQRRKPLGEPVLETYQFLPHTTTPKDRELDRKSALRFAMHVAMEAIQNVKLKTVEIVDAESREEEGLLSPIMSEILGDLPLIQAEIQVLAPAGHPCIPEDLPSNITVDDKKLDKEQGAIVVMATNLSSRTDVRSTFFFLERKRIMLQEMFLEPIFIIFKSTSFVWPTVAAGRARQYPRGWLPSVTREARCQAG